MDQQLVTVLYTASTWVVPVVLAITLHEAAHGFVAHWFGDDTAWRLGRVSLNPLKHVDPFGTIVLPAMLLLLPLAPIAAYFIGLYVLGHAYWALQLVPWLGGAWQAPPLDEGTELAPSPAPQPSKRRGSMESKTPAPKKRKIQSHTKRKTITAPKKRS